MHRKLILLILDGWGLTDEVQYSAIAQARTSFIDMLYRKYPHSQLAAAGTAVGLPAGQMGNSEVGHMHLGAGRVTPQTLVRINQAIESSTLYHNPALLAALAYARERQKPLHFMGLVSDGGVHAHIDHLKTLCKIAKAQAVNQVFIHAFTDGRDAPPRSAIDFLSNLVAYTQQTTGQLASIMGRYYAMDRDKRWERTQIAYDALVYGKGYKSYDWRASIAQAYTQGITDEFLQPIILANEAGGPLACIQPGDVVLCFNFRPDRSRQITRVLTQAATPTHNMHPLPLYYLTLSVYDEHFQEIHSLFDKLVLKDTLGEVLSQQGKQQLRIAETEKYPHVTYFFSGGREAPFPGEQRIVCPSPSVVTYDQKPEMAAWDITAQAIAVLEQKAIDFTCLNLANPDMVGHTGIWEATVQACEVVDQCVEKIVTAALKNDYITLLVADHGNAEQMLTQAGNPHTAHTTNLVPCILVDKQLNRPLNHGKLADVAPTLLQCMGLSIPPAMDGKSLMKL